MARWLNADEAAVILRTTPYQVTKMARAGQFTHCKWVGNRVRIHESELDPPSAAEAPDGDAVREQVRRFIRALRHELDDLEAAVTRPATDAVTRP